MQEWGKVVNEVIVIGHLGRDPEMRYIPNGQGMTSFSVSSSRKYTTSAGEQPNAPSAKP